MESRGPQLVHALKVGYAESYHLEEGQQIQEVLELLVMAILLSIVVAGLFVNRYSILYCPMEKKRYWNARGLWLALSKIQRWRSRVLGQKT